MHEQEDDCHQEHGNEHVSERRVHQLFCSVQIRDPRHDIDHETDERLQNEACQGHFEPPHGTPPAHEHQGPAAVRHRQLIHPVRVDEVERIEGVIGRDHGDHEAKHSQEIDKERNRHLNLHVVPYD